MVRLVAVMASIRVQQLAAHPIAAADAEQRHDAEPPQHGRADHARELPAVLDVAADDQAIAARQPKHIGESEPRLDAARRRAAIDELDRPETVGTARATRRRDCRRGDCRPGRPRDRGCCRASGCGRRRCGPAGSRPPAVYCSARPFSSASMVSLQLPRQQDGGVPVDIEDGNGPPPRRTAQDRSATGERWWCGRA